MNIVHLSSFMNFFAFNYVSNKYEDLEEDFSFLKIQLCKNLRCMPIKVTCNVLKAHYRFKERRTIFFVVLDKNI